MTRRVIRHQCECIGHPGCPHRHNLCPSFTARGPGLCPACGNRRETALGRPPLTTFDTHAAQACRLTMQEVR